MKTVSFWSVMKTTNLNNNTNLHIIDSTKFNTTTICLLLKRDLKKSEVTKNALLPLVLKTKTKKYHSISLLNSVLESNYGSFLDIQTIKCGDSQIIQFYLESPNIKNGTILNSLDILNEIIFNPYLVDSSGFCNNHVQTQENILKQNILSQKNDKLLSLQKKCVSIAYKNEAFAIPYLGYLEDMPVSASLLYQHYNNVLLSSPVDIILMGNIEKEIKEKIKSDFIFKTENEVKELNNKEVYKNIPTKIYKSEKTSETSYIVFLVKFNLEQSSAKFYDFLIFNEILGAMPTSRLFVNIRQKYGLCYFINSTINRFKGILMAQAEVAYDNLQLTTDLITEVIINAKNVDEQEINTAKKSVIREYKKIMDGTSSAISFHLTEYLLGTNITEEEAINSIQNVTPETIRNLEYHINTICWG